MKVYDRYWKLFKEHKGVFDKNALLVIADECKESKSLAPLYSIIYLSNEPLSESDMRRGRDMVKELEGCGVAKHLSDYECAEE